MLELFSDPFLQERLAFRGETALPKIFLKPQVRPYIMIDDKRKFIFVENPKAASHSIKKALMGEKNIYNFNDPRMATINHCIPTVIKANHPKKWKDYTTFVVVRNTWDRANSYFQFYRDIACSESYQSMNFDEWIASDCPPPDEDHLRGPMHGEGRFDDVLCQLRYTQEVDHIIVLHSFNIHERRLELQSSLQRICKILNIPPVKVPIDGNNYGRANRSIKWQKSTIDRIHIKYKEEIEKFAFKPPQYIS